MTLQQFINKYNGTKCDYDGAYGAQCVDLFRFFNRDVLGISQPRGVQGAKDFWSNYDSDPNLNNNFDKIANTPEFIAKAGDVMIWNGWYGPYGHIAIITQADINKFTALSQNDPTNRETHLKEYTYSKVYGVLRPKNIDSSEPEQDNMLLEYLGVDSEEQAINKLTTHLGDWDAKCDWGNADDNRGGDLGSERRKVDILKDENSDLENKVSYYEKQTFDLENIIEDLEKQLEDCEGGEPTVPGFEEIEGFRATHITTRTFQGDKEVEINYKKRLI